MDAEIHDYTSANFERSADQKLAAKVLVTCELTIFGLGSHSATGEEWADNSNAGTAAEAQAFKRSCACFGLDRYLYYFTGMWVDLDDRKRPKTVPQMGGWAIPAGWLKGLRPSGAGGQNPCERTTAGNGGSGQDNGHSEGNNSDLRSEIERMVLGKPDTGWQVLPTDTADFEATVLRACELVLAGDHRIGKVPGTRTSKSGQMRTGNR